ncbi:hypothetical protein GJ744_001906 [Endocarpon pusillum]|uniref:Uncharacterized protein n=1 Tax=Endocarpon pusillum TaxID=364733 RepID=A0A8H7E8P3_9EURO|nr:hypothetical protein GJ744_001906 [Endocarpon pusillum]
MNTAEEVQRWPQTPRYLVLSFYTKIYSVPFNTPRTFGRQGTKTVFKINFSREDRHVHFPGEEIRGPRNAFGKFSGPKTYYINQ